MIMNSLFLIELFLISSSWQIEIRTFNTQDNKINFSKKCHDAFTNHSEDVEKCVTKVADNLFMNTLFDGGNMGLILKGACCAIDDLKKCVEIVKVIFSILY